MRAALALVVVFSTPAFAHIGPIRLGRSVESPSTLAFAAPHGLLDGSEPVHLLPGDASFEGMWVHDEPGFRTVGEHEHHHDLLPLVAGHGVALRLVAGSEPLRFYEPAGFTPILTSPGTLFHFFADAEGHFDIQLFSGAVAPGDHTATFQFTDTSGMHADSEEFTVHFRTVPAPAGVLVFTLVGLPRRRR